MRTRQWTAGVFAALIALTATSPLGAETSGAGAARAAYRAVVDLESNRPPDGFYKDSAAQSEADRARDAWFPRCKEAETAFRAAFSASDWATWPMSVDDAPVLERGLLGVGERALAESDGPLAVKAYERASALPVVTAVARRRIADCLPAAHLANRSGDKAREIAAAAAVKAQKDDRSRAVTRQGDVEMALGQQEKARAFYAEAAASAPEDEESAFGVDAVAALQAKWKLDLAGKPLGALESEWCVGTEDGAAPAIIDRVAVLVFPFPYGPEQFDPAPYARLAEKGDVIVGVMTPAMTMCMLEILMDIPTDSAPRLRGEPQPAGLREWAERLRRIAKTDLPMIGVASAKLPLGKAVLGSAIAVAKDGKIAYFQAPDEPTAYLAAAVARLLGRVGTTQK